MASGEAGEIRRDGAMGGMGRRGSVVSFDSGRIGDKLCAMQKILPLFFAAAVFAFGACSHNPNKPKKSSAHIYEGNAPTIKFMDEPGGPIHAY
jgi:hypothetical protein